MTNTETILDADAANAAADDGIARADAHANEEFKNIALECLKAVAAQKRVFCSDDIAEVMQNVTVATHEKRVMGSIIRKAVKLGYCEPYICPHCQTHVTRKTKQNTSHAHPIHFWRSLIYNPIA